jgi:hypothetical protein
VETPANVMKYGSTFLFSHSFMFPDRSNGKFYTCNIHF